MILPAQSAKDKERGLSRKKEKKILSNKKPTNKQNPKTQLKQKGEGSRWSLYGFYSCWIHSNPNSWVRQWTICMWTLLGKQAGWKLKAEQLFLNYFQHRQAVNFQHQTTCPVHWSSSERSSSSPLLVAFLVVGTAKLLMELPRSWRALRCQQAWHLLPAPGSPAHNLSFSHMPCASAKPMPGQTTQSRDTGNMADHCKAQTWPPHVSNQACVSCARHRFAGEACKHLSCPATETYPRDPCPALPSHVHPPQHLLQETAVPPLLTKRLHNMYFCQPSGNRATSWTVHQQLLDIHFLNAFSAIQMNNYAS